MTWPGRVSAVVAALAFAVLPATADAAPPLAGDSVGDEASGLPGIGRVAVATERPQRLSFGLTGGYGYTEPQAGDSGAHHRALGAIGIAIQPWSFLSATLTFDGRYDKHPNDALGPDDGAVGDPRFTLRFAHALGKAFALGAQGVVWIPGQNAPSLAFDATTFDASVLATFAPPGSGFALAANVGYRFDQSAASVFPPLDRMRQGDRTALEISQYDAVLLGIGASERIHDFEILGDVTWDLLVGTNAPSATTSPLRVAAGGRYHVSKRVQLELRGEVTVSDRPGVAPTDPLIPLEPRFTVLAGLRWELPIGKTPKVEQTPTPPPPEVPVTPRPATGSLHGRVVDTNNQPIANVKVTVTSGGAEQSGETDAQGAYSIADVIAGAAHVVAKADGYDDASADVSVQATIAATADLKMTRHVKPGQLRGLVRSFKGKPLAATIRVEPLGSEAHTDADGRFQVDLPPGGYEVVIEAPGFKGQRRPVQVEENGVTVLNADLRSEH